jgi:hypothetical protein
MSEESSERAFQSTPMMKVQLFLDEQKVFLPLSLS